VELSTLVTLEITMRERCLIYLLDRAEVKEHDLGAARLVQDAVGTSLNASRAHISRAMNALCADGCARTSKIHFKGENRRKVAYFLTEKGLGRAKELRRRLEAAKVRVIDAEGIESERTIGEITSMLPRSFRFSDLLTHAREDKLDIKVVLDWHGRNYGGRMYDVKEAIEVPHFSGRAEKLSDLERFLDDPKARAFNLAGLPGIGKTALASKWASGLRGRVNVFWRRIHRETTNRDILRDLAMMLHSIGRPTLLAYLEREHDGGGEIPTELLRQCFSGMRFVLIFDDAHLAGEEMAMMIKNLMSLDETPTKPKLLLISREKLGFLSAEDVVLGRVWEKELEDLSRNEAEEMMAAMAVEPERREAIWKVCAGHPLTL